MKVYLISYDLNEPGQNYEGLYDELKKSPNWWHYLDSTWLIATSESVEAIFQRLQAKIDQNDRLLIIRVVRDYAGWLPKDAWDWINQNITDTAPTRIF